MRRPDLEECAWRKTPTSDRRAVVRRSGMRRRGRASNVVENLHRQERQIRVFNPSGDTEGTIQPFMPLWSLTDRELTQACKLGKQPKMEAPYFRSRPRAGGRMRKP